VPRYIRNASPSRAMAHFVVAVSRRLYRRGPGDHAGSGTRRGSGSPQWSFWLKMLGEHVPCTPVAAVFEVLLVPPQSSRVDREHRVDRRVHQAVPPAFVACATPSWNGAMTAGSLSPGPRGPADNPDDQLESVGATPLAPLPEHAGGEERPGPASAVGASCADHRWSSDERASAGFSEGARDPLGRLKARAGSGLQLSRPPLGRGSRVRWLHDRPRPPAPPSRR
jgi:hypothetical protein